MPFKSRAQLRKFASMVEEGKISKEKFQEWLDETSDIDGLPEKIGKKKKNSLGSKKTAGNKEKSKSISNKNAIRNSRSKRVYMGGSRSKTKRQR
jgi:hypothetical protein